MTNPVESVYGQGTTFKVVIPFRASHLPAGPVDAERIPASTTGPQAFLEEALRWLPDEDVSPQLPVNRDIAVPETTVSAFACCDGMKALADDVPQRLAGAAYSGNPRSSFPHRIFILHYQLDRFVAF